MSDFSASYTQAMKIFPYDRPNEHQFQIISKIAQLPKKGSLLIESPTGSGKTIASMVAIMARLEKGEKLIIITRTVSQMEVMLREWSRIYDPGDRFKQFHTLVQSGEIPLIVPVLGKARVCKQLPVMRPLGFPDSAVHVLCQSLPCSLYPKTPTFMTGPSIGDYHLFVRLNMKIMGTARHGTHVIDRLVEEYLGIKACGYFKQRNFLRSASIIVATYPYLTDSLLKGLLNNAGVDIAQTYILVDEAHNLVNPRSVSVSKGDLQVVEHLIGDFVVIKKLLYYVDVGKRLMPRDLGTDDEITLVKDTLTNCTHELRERYKISLGDLGHASVQKVSSFLMQIYSGDIIAKAGSIEIITSTPADLILGLYGSTRIFMSGTFSPIGEYKKLFGLPDAQTLVSKELALENQYRAFLKYRGLSSAYQMRSRHMFDLFARVIMQLIPTSPRHIMVLCPSYDFLTKLGEYLRPLTEIMVEEKQRPLQEYSDELVKAKQRKIILTVAGGRLSEGVEVVKDGQSLISMVIVVGLPLSPPSDDKAVIKQALAIAAGDRKSASRFMQQIPAARKIRQGFGRTMRSHSDRGALIILDYRAEEMLKKDLMLKRVLTPERLASDLEEFFTGYSPIPTSETLMV